MTDLPEPGLREQLPARMFNAVSPALGGFFVPLSRRKAVADALFALVEPLLDQARETNQRLNKRCQEHESRLATLARLVGEWSLGEKGTYVPLRTITAIGRLAGREIDDERYELHYQRVEAAEAERDGLSTATRTAAALLRDTAERVEQQRTVNPTALRAAAKALDDITGGPQ